MSNNDNITEQVIKSLSQQLINIENTANIVLPIDEKFNDIQQYIDSMLSELKDNIERSEEVSDKYFYISKYTDMVKKLDSVFDNRSKRIQYAMQTLQKVSQQTNNNLDGKVTSSAADTENSVKHLTPEQCSAIIAVYNKNKESEEITL